MHSNKQPTELEVTAANTELFSRMAKEVMEESDHAHLGMNDSGKTYVYPCGCDNIYVFNLALLDNFVEARNVAVANGSQYDVLHGLINLIKQAEAQRFDPKPEPEVSFPASARQPTQPATFADAGPAIKRGGLDQQAILQMLADKLAEDEERPKVFEVKVSYGNEDGDDFGTMNFGARDLYEVMDRIHNLEFKNGTFVNIDLEYYSVD